MSFAAPRETTTNARAIVCWECDREFAIHVGDKDDLEACPFCSSEQLGVVNTTARVEVNR